ncbi:Mu-like prophage major head subunit gpT family protein [Gluconacetobacter azotocaptans]|uniref:Mu-like prophage major head subunit gpT family protein n=1 Tax=Gluconacetobacter azotocaptans TaxID=142834 RepID=UPI00195A8FE9|nr:Mu-like prophage major head subunit gpT family protein [Gluconacetobacter azotocaptans]MBM9400375.1 Mu-like prophage major head subunit gpT family protein [Gluconacetobacter azotocaptans]
MADITLPYVQGLTAQVRTEFNQWLQAAPSEYDRISMTMTSSSAENLYPRLDEIAGLREWIGDRVIQELSGGAFVIRNRTFEGTVGLKREDMEDDQYSFFLPGIQQLGRNAALMPDRLVFKALGQGTTQKCFDGQYYFDTDHQTSDENGSWVPYSNIGVPQGTEGAGPAWYLFDTTQPLKPMIFQRRRPFTIVPRTKLDDDNVFFGNRFIWGVDGRCNAGYGLWQLAYRSTRPLTPESYSAARAIMQAQRRHDGEPYDIDPNLLVVPTNLEEQGRTVLKAALVAATNGTATVSNVWVNSAELVVSKRLSQNPG